MPLQGSIQIAGMSTQDSTQRLRQRRKTMHGWQTRPQDAGDALLAPQAGHQLLHISDP